MSVSAIGMMRVQLQLEGQILKEDDFDVLDNRVDVRSVRETFKVETLRLIAEVRQGGELYKHSPKGIVMRSDARGFSVRAFPGVTAIVVSGEGDSDSWKWTVCETLHRPLSHADLNPNAATASSSSIVHPYQPDDVCTFKEYDGSDVMELVKQYADNADDYERKVHPIAEQQSTTVNSEANVSAIFYASVVQPLQQSQLTPGSWEFQPPHVILHRAAAYRKSAVAVPVQELLPVLRPAAERAAATAAAAQATAQGSAAAERAEAAGQGATAACATAATAGAAAERGATAAAAAAQEVAEDDKYQRGVMVLEPGPPDETAAKRRCYLVGELRRPSRLIKNDMQLLDLVAGWHKNIASVRSMVAQIFTYLICWGLCFGFISTYQLTWLVYCPPNDRRKLYISNVILSTDKPPSATSRAGIAWTQSEAWRHIDDVVMPYLPDGVSTSAQGETGGTGDGGSNSNRKLDDSKDSDGKPPSHGSSDHDDNPPSQPSCSSCRSPSRQGQHRKQTTMGSLQLELADLLCEGSEGLVYRGNFGGTSAAIKLFGPGKSSLAAGYREITAYQAFKRQQGKLIPRLLSVGTFGPDVHYIASGLVQGTALSELDVISTEVKEAAVSALAQLHAEENAAFLHGDIRLENVICVEGSNSCVIIDFGRSRLGADAAEQAAEKQQLTALLALTR